MLQFPCFRTNARFKPGMSGGPVLGENGKIIGIICSGWDFGGVGEDIGYASLVSMAMMIKFPMKSDGSDKRFLFERFSWNDGHFEIDHTTTIIEIDATGGKVGILRREDSSLFVFQYDR